MASLARPVGLGLASRGDIRDTTAWAQRAEDAGLDSVWIHDSYFEREPVTLLAGIARETRHIGIGAGALNPYTRHPFVVAQTMASLDDLAPGRISLALGSGLPLRLSQMGIAHDHAPERVGEALGQIRELWQGHRLVLDPSVPPLVPMFAPPHRIPIYIAAYTRPYLELCGATADGYLARPLESLPAFELMRQRVFDAAQSHGRSATDIDMRGYLFCHIDRSRREALNRVKRDPFIIYMVSILSDVSLQRAGFPRQLRDRIRELWRAEDYHGAAATIPDDLLDAYVLVGTADDVAARADAYHRAGMDVPLLQPIVQDEEHIGPLLEAAVLYGRQASARTAEQPSAGLAEHPSAATPATVRLHAPTRDTLATLRRRWAGIVEVSRPFSFTASVLPVIAGGVLAWTTRRIDSAAWLLAVLAGLALHAGTNIVNEVYDVRNGVDSITSPRASHAIVEGQITETGALRLAYSCFALAALIGVDLVLVRGPWMLFLGLVGLLGGYFYTAPPLQFKYRAAGVPFVFMLMGPLMVIGGYFAASGGFDWRTLAVAVPIGLLVTAILHGNEWRDVSEDTRLGFRTLSGELGRTVAHGVYVALLVGAYIAVAVGVTVNALPTTTLLVMLSLPALVWLLSDAERGRSGSMRAIAFIDQHTARLHMAFGLLLVIGLMAPYLSERLQR